MCLRSRCRLLRQRPPRSRQPRRHRRQPHRHRRHLLLLHLNLILKKPHHFHNQLLMGLRHYQLRQHHRRHRPKNWELVRHRQNRRHLQDYLEMDLLVEYYLNRL